MSNQGFIYVLINASLKDMVKIGKSTRDPSERAAELSNSTGVPTPFHVAFEVYVSDYTKAENYIHQHLDTLGFKVSPNREFFHIPLKSVIPIMLEVQKLYPVDDIADSLANSNNQESSLNLGNEILEEAKKFYTGDNDYLQDYEETFRLLKNASKLNVAESHYWLGIMYQKGEGCAVDVKSSLKHHKKGAALGYGKCYKEMAYLYLDVLKHHANAQKCWNKFTHSIYYESLDVIMQKKLKDEFKINVLSIDCSDYIDESEINLPGADLYCAGLTIIADGKEVYLNNRIYESKSDAVSLFIESIKLGYAGAYHQLAFHLAYGMGCKKNYSKAIEILKIGANKGNILCWRELSDQFATMGKSELSDRCWNKYEKLKSLNENNTEIDKSNYEDNFYFNDVDESKILESL